MLILKHPTVVTRTALQQPLNLLFAVDEWQDIFAEQGEITFEFAGGTNTVVDITLVLSPKKKRFPAQFLFALAEEFQASLAGP